MTDPQTDLTFSLISNSSNSNNKKNPFAKDTCLADLTELWAGEHMNYGAEELKLKVHNKKILRG